MNDPGCTKHKRGRPVKMPAAFRVQCRKCGGWVHMVRDTDNIIRGPELKCPYCGMPFALRKGATIFPGNG